MEKTLENPGDISGGIPETILEKVTGKSRRKGFLKFFREFCEKSGKIIENIPGKKSLKIEENKKT